MKTAKGYRLMPETHALIRKVQAVLKGDLDNAISTACTRFLESAPCINKDTEPGGAGSEIKRKHKNKN